MITITPELAEVCGIHAGDGYLRNDGKRAELDISGSTEEKDYYEKHVIPLFSKVFNLKIEGRLFNSRNTYGFVIRKKEIINFMHSLGFPLGNKSTIVKIPKFVMDSNNKKMYSYFLRGLFDTDGHISFRKNYGKYIYFKRKFHNYSRIVFTSVSKDLIEDVKKLLNKLEFKYYFRTYAPKKVNENIKYIIEINGPELANKWIKTIGIKNDIKLTRYLIWKKFGFCPTNISFKERLDILSGKMDPNIFYKGL